MDGKDFKGALHAGVQARGGALGGADSRPVSPEQMEIARLRAELARVKMERDVLGNRPREFPLTQESRSARSRLLETRT